MPKFQFEKLVKADRKKIFDIKTNFEQFEKLLPQYFPSVRVRSSRENVSIIEEHLILSGKEFVMMTKHVVQYPQTHEIFVLGGDAKGSHIIEKYETVPEGTKISSTVDFKLKGILKIKGFFEESKIKKEFVEILDGFSVLAEN